MKRISIAMSLCFAISALLSIAAAATLAHTELFTGRPATICYTTDGTTILTVQADPGSGFEPYPFPIEARVDEVEGEIVASHTVRLRRLGQHVFLPVVQR